MRSNEISERPEAPKPGGAEPTQIYRRLEAAQDVLPSAEQGTFRYSDATLGGEVRTNTDRPGAMEQLAVARVQHRDGTSDPVGTMRYRMEPDVVTLQGDSLSAQNYGVESALLSEVSQNARANEIDRMRVWVADSNSTAQQKWSPHGFHPEPRDPGAVGQYWGKPI